MNEQKVLLKDARKAIDANEFELAIEKCKAILKCDANNYMGLVLLGVALRNNEMAVSVFKKAISLKGDNILAYQGLAKFYENNGSPNSLAALLELYYKISSFPSINEAVIFDNMFDTALKLNDSKEIASIFNNILEVESDSEKKIRLICLVEKILKNSQYSPSDRLLVLLKNIMSTSNSCDDYILLQYFQCLADVEGYDSIIDIFWKVKNKSLALKEWFFDVFVDCFICRIDIPLNMIEIESLIHSTKEERDDSLSVQMAIVVFNLIRGKKMDAYITVLNVLNVLKFKNLTVKIEHVILYAISCIELGRFFEAEKFIEIHAKKPPKKFQLSIKKLIMIVKSSQYLSEKCLEAIQISESLDKSYFSEIEKISLFNAFMHLKKFSEAKDCLKNLNNSEKYASLYSKMLYKVGEIEQAIKVLKENEENYFNQLSLGMIYFKQKDFENSFHYLLQSARNNPHDFKVFLYLGDYYTLQEKNLEKAKKCYLKAYELNPECAKAGKNLSNTYMAMKEWNTNEIFLKSLINVIMETNNHQLHWAWMQLGLHCIALENWDTAVVNLRTYIRLNSTDVDAWEALADAYYYRGSYTSAMKCYNKTVELDPSRKYCQVQIGTIQCLLGFLNDALDTYKTICDGSFVPALKGLAEVKIALANETFSQNLFGLCRDNAQEAINLILPLLSKQTKLTSLWKLITNAITIISKLPPKYNWLNFNSLSCDNEDELQKYENEELYDLAISCICKTIKLSNYSDSCLYHELAAMYLTYYNFSKNTKHIEKSYACIEKCINIEKRRWQHWNLLGIVCVHKTINKQNLAQHAFIKALQLDPINATLWSNLGVFYLIMGSTKLANEAFKKAQEGNPAFVQSWIGQALIAESVGHQEAMDLFRHASQLSFNKESSLGYSYCVSDILLNTDSTNSSNLLYYIKNMHAVPAASDSMLWYNELENKSACSWNVYGILLENLGHFNKAVEAFTNALHSAKEEHKESILLNLARNYLHLEKFDYVIEILNSIPNIGIKSAYMLALSYYKKNNYEESYRIYSEILQHVETNDDDKIFLLLALANIAYKSNDYESAECLSLQVVEICKKCSSVDALLAHFALSILIKNKSISEIIMNNLYAKFRKELYENAVDEFNPYYDSLKKFFLLQSYFYLTNENASQVVKNISRCLRFHPNIEISWKIMSKISCKNISLANMSIKKYMNLKNDTDLLEFLKLACVSDLLLGDVISSKKYAQKMIRIRPDAVENWTLLMTSLYHLCDNDNTEKLKTYIKSTMNEATMKADLERWLVSSLASQI